MEEGFTFAAKEFIGGIAPPTPPFVTSRISRRVAVTLIDAGAFNEEEEEEET
jgi:hypothetical protein